MSDRKDINPRRPIPASGYDRLRKNLKSGFNTDLGKFPEPQGFPVTKGSFPPPDNRPSINKGDQTSRKNDTTKDVSIGLQDHDEAIMYYFNEVIRPSIVTNGNRVNVPIIYGAPERWKSVQQDGYYRDKEGKLQVPLIMFKRDSVEKRRDLGNKLDGNNPRLYQTFQSRYTQANSYDNFSILQGRTPIKEFHTIVVPDFVTLQYSCTIWTDYVAQMNKLIEMINYASDTYWGEKGKFNFNARIDTYNNQTEINQGDNRIVKTDFGLNIQGYLVPDSINKELAKRPQKSFSKATVKFNTEIVVTPSGASTTRRKERKTVNVKQIGLGVGYQIVGQSTLIG
tara:strand:- start:1683 stop:2699 length:1017 start_codon:yes stop_codon:yes gene_type:complete